MTYDIIVIGGGHAGVEASLAAARLGHKTLLISMLSEQIGATSCNPAIGGLAKGHLVREIDALGGEMALATDATGIQFRTLNLSKGPAVRGGRAQIDMDRYKIYVRTILLNTPNLNIRQETAEKLVAQDGEIKGVITTLGNHYKASKIIITAGTFLQGLIHIGENKHSAGRFGEFASFGLSDSIKELGIEMGRLKTGTCARIDEKSIDFSKMEIQPGDENPTPFSFRTNKATFNPNQLPCYIAYTNETTHNIIESNFYRAPMFTGQIEGIGPRYCPSVEDKINRFRDKERHHLFIEPQTAEATEYYINGFSTSLPTDVQIAMIHSVEGMENAQIVRFGYAIEYDFVNPTELKHTLETKKISGLYCAGQIIGTTGYEEAAALGLMAAINASNKLKNKEDFILRRDEAYIGVMIDDLVTKGTKEPYRMFTSRAEYRLLLREDNADLRLSRYALNLGLLGAEEYKRVEQKRAQRDAGLSYLEETMLNPSNENNAFLASIGEDKISDKISLQKIVARSDFSIQKLELLAPQLALFCEEAKEQILVEAKYKNYIEKQKAQIDTMKEMINIKIPENMDFASISGLSNEVVEKLKRFNPPTLFSASQISGITPAALDILQVYIKIASRNKK